MSPVNEKIIVKNSSFCCLILCRINCIELYRINWQNKSDQYITVKYIYINIFMQKGTFVLIIKSYLSVV